MSMCACIFKIMHDNCNVQSFALYITSLEHYYCISFSAWLENSTWFLGADFQALTLQEAIKFNRTSCFIQKGLCQVYTNCNELALTV